MRTHLAVVALLLAPVVARGDGATQTLTIDPVQHSTDPALPTVNVYERQSILIHVKGPGASSIWLRGRQGTNESRLQSAAEPAQISATIIINFDVGSELEVTPSNTPGVWSVRAPERGVLGINVSYTPPGAAAPEQQLYAIQLESKPWAFQFSAGFAILIDPRSRNFVLRPSATDGQSTVTAVGTCGLADVSRCDLSYRAAAFVHYVPLRLDWLVASAGLSVDVPVSGLAIMLGPSLRLRTLPQVNDGFLTAGVSFGPVNRLRSGAAGSTLASTTDVQTLYQTKYAFGTFVALTFGFLGGEQQFKGVYGGANHGDSAGQ